MNKATNKAEMKPYRFKFHPASQVLTSNTTAGALTLSASAGAGQFPVTASTYLIPASSNGLPQYFDIGLAVNFKLSDLSAYPFYTALFDAYKLGKVTLNLEYLNNVSLASGAGLMPTVYMYWDQDDAAIPANLSVITRRQGVKIRHFGNHSKTVQSITIKPIPSMVVGDGAGGTIQAGVPTKSQWLNCVDDNVPHNALKIFITDVYLPGGTTVNQAFRFNWTYDVAFRSPLQTF